MTDSRKLKRSDGRVDERSRHLDRRLRELMASGLDLMSALDEIARNDAGGARGAPGRVARTARLEPALSALPEIRRDVEDEADDEIDPTAALLLSYAQRDAGRALPPELRAALEAALGADLGAVRVHDDAAAADAARALNARAFTVGDDIYFRAGAFQPDSDGGRRLIAHEVAHTQQPGGAPGSETPKISAPGDASEREAEGFADRFGDMFAGALRSADDARAREREHGPEVGVRPMASLSASRAPGTVHLDRTPGPRERPTRMTVAIARDGSACFTVDSTAGEPFTAYGTASGLTAGQYTLITPRRRGGPMQIVPTERTESPRPPEPRIEIPLSDRGLHTLLARGTTPIPLVVTGGAAADLERVANAEVDRAGARLSGAGLETIYASYREYLGLQRTQGTALAVGRVPGSGGAGTALGMQPSLNRKRDELNRELPRFGFASIDAFAAAIEDLRNSVRSRAVQIASEHVDRVERLLVGEQTRYQDPASAQSLHAALGAARGHFRKANEIRRNEAMGVVMTVGEMQQQAQASARFHAEQERGREAMADQSDSHPLLRNKDLPHEELALAGEAECRNVMLRYIADRRGDCKTTRGNLSTTPNLVFELPELMGTVRQRLAIERGSYLDRILEDRNHDDAVTQAMIRAGVAVLAIAAGMVSGGTGAVAVMAAAGAFGIGAYQAYEEYRRYETMKAARGAQLTSEDPSLAWVIVAIAGAVLDAAALGNAVKAVRSQVQVFNAARGEARSLVRFEEAVHKVSELDDATRAAVIRAARLEATQRAQWRTSLRSAATLFTGGGYAQVGRMTYCVYLGLRRGITRFQLWSRSHEAIEMLGDISHFSPEELAKLKAAYRAAVHDAKEVARHGQTLRMSDDEISHVMQNWATRPDLTVDRVKDEMSLARGGPRAPDAPEPAPWKKPENWQGPRENGRFLGERGNSAWIDTREEVIRVVGRNPQTGEANAVMFRNGRIELSPWSRDELTVPGLKGFHNKDMDPIYDALADRLKLLPGRSKTARRAAARKWARDADDGYGGKGLAPHHAGGDTVQMVPKAVHHVQHTDMHTYPVGE